MLLKYRKWMKASQNMIRKEFCNNKTRGSSILVTSHFYSVSMSNSEKRQLIWVLKKMTPTGYCVKSTKMLAIYTTTAQKQFGSCETTGLDNNRNVYTTKERYFNTFNIDIVYFAEQLFLTHATRILTYRNVFQTHSYTTRRLCKYLIFNYISL